MSRRNPVLGETPLTLGDGRAFTLVADNAALVKAAQAYSGSTKLKKLFADMQPQLDASGLPELDEDGDPVKDTIPAFAALLFGLLDAHHPDITHRDALNMLLREHDVVAEAIAEALRSGFPEAAEAGNAPAPAVAPAPKKPAGKRSGRSGAKRG